MVSDWTGRPYRTTVINVSSRVYPHAVHLPTTPQHPIRAEARDLILSNDIRNVSVCKEESVREKQSTYMTEVGLGRMQALGPK